MQSHPTRADLVLVGGGHSHVQILRRWMMNPVPGVRLCLVIDRPCAIYSGMVPGFVAGQYRAHELEIDLLPLARRAGAAVIFAAATRIDAAGRRIELQGRPPIRYDVASIDVGSTVRGLEIPGVRENALATRPIGTFVTELDARLTAHSEHGKGRDPLRLVVVGAGAAGVELATCLDARLRSMGREVELAIVCASDRILPGPRKRLRHAVVAELARRGITVHTGRRVVSVEATALRLLASNDDPPTGTGEFLPCDLAVWATGAAPVALFEHSALPCDESGFIRVSATLQVVDHPQLFATGDCAAIEGAPWVPKAGVYAVRQGPILDANLRSALGQGALRRYRPQRDFLALLNLGDRRALGAKWGMAASGRSLHRLKESIDRRFMRRFQVLGGDALPKPGFSSPVMSDGETAVTCGGCAAKLGASPLERALARLPKASPDQSVLLGLDTPDDAAAFRVSVEQGGDGAVVLATVDGFRAFTDDPYLVGQVAAQNAASDVFAKGGRPRHALATVTLPDAESDERSEEKLAQVLFGVRNVLDDLQVNLLGGHTTTGSELFVGLVILGDLPDVPGEGAHCNSLLALSGLRPGDALILSKALGSGVLLAADMRGLAPGCWIQATHASMLQSNAEAARIARSSGASACTDVTGFGLAGHLAEMLRASGVSASIDLAALPALPGALVLLRGGLRSTAHPHNERARSAIVGASAADGDPRFELLFDPQTSGGLLMGIEPARATDAVEALRAAGCAGAALVGRAQPASATPGTFSVR